MLYRLLYGLRDEIGAFNVFRYLTFRSMLAFVFAFVLVLVFQPKFIAWFRKRQLGQPIREDGPESHQKKQGTPTMGGVVVVLAVLFSTLAFCDLSNVYVWLVVGVTTAYALIGFLEHLET